MKVIELLSGAENPWEKPLYLCLWADPGCLGYRVPITWLAHENQGFDLVGVGNNGTLILCEIKAVLSSAADGAAVADQVIKHGDAVGEYLKTGLWREKDTAGVIGDKPMRFMGYKNYLKLAEKPEWNELYTFALHTVPDPQRAPALSGRVCIQIVASKIDDSAAAAAMNKMRGLVDSLSAEWPMQVEFMLAEVEVVSAKGKRGPDARGRQGRQWILR